MTHEVDVFVPGKVLISGEHSVVFGEPAIAASINLGITLSIKRDDGRELIKGIEKDEQGLIAEAWRVMKVEPKGLEIEIHSNLPVGSGFGSSAALAAGVVKAYHLFHQMDLTEDRWFELTWAIEKKAHTNSSGVDPAAVIHRGMMWYIRNQAIQPLPLDYTRPLWAVMSGKPNETTGEMVRMVADKVTSDKKAKKILEDIGKVTHRLKATLQAGEDMTDDFNENGRLLEELGVVSEKGKKLSHLLRENGWGVKISGAGGIKNGSGLILVTGAEEAEMAEFGNEHKLGILPITIGGNI